MVKVFFSTDTYDYPFRAVSLAWFLRYPTRFSTHVLSTDVLDQRYDPETQRLYTTRLHLKRSKLPKAVLRLLPRSILGASSTGDSQTYILERSVVDVEQGWMKTESRNLQFTAVLDVIERQMFMPARNIENGNLTEDMTDCHTVTTLVSRFGQRYKKQQRQQTQSHCDQSSTIGTEQDDGAASPGFFARWSAPALQRSIESIGLNRTFKSQPNAKEGMMIVLERLRRGGIVAVLEGMQRDREGAASFRQGSTSGAGE